jgi:hypothetical protein
MAKVYKAPEGYEPDYALLREPDGYAKYAAAEAAYIERMKAAARKANPGDRLAGTPWSTPVADGYAQYLVWSSKPLSLIHLPIGDAWHAPAALIRGLRVTDIRNLAKAEAALERLFGESRENLRPAL